MTKQRVGLKLLGANISVFWSKIAAVFCPDFFAFADRGMDAEGVLVLGTASYAVYQLAPHYPRESLALAVLSAAAVGVAIYTARRLELQPASDQPPSLSSTGKPSAGGRSESPALRLARSQRQFGGVVLAAVILPLVFAAQLVAYPEIAAAVHSLFWLSAVCSTAALSRLMAAVRNASPSRASIVCRAIATTTAIALASAGFYRARNPLTPPAAAATGDLSLLWNSISVSAAVASVSVVLATYLLFRFGVYAGLCRPSLLISFSRGERVAVASLLTLLLVQTASHSTLASLERWLDSPSFLAFTDSILDTRSFRSIVAGYAIPFLHAFVPVPAVSTGPLLVVCCLVACAVFVVGAGSIEPLMFVWRTNRVARKLRAAMATAASSIAASETASNSSTAVPAPAVAVVAPALDASPSGWRMLRRDDVWPVYFRWCVLIGLVLQPTMTVVIGQEPFLWLWKFFHSSRLDADAGPAPHMGSTAFVNAVSKSYHRHMTTSRWATPVPPATVSGAWSVVVSAGAAVFSILENTPIRVLFVAYFVLVLGVGVGWLAPAGRRARCALNASKHQTKAEAASTDDFSPMFVPSDDDTSPALNAASTPPLKKRTTRIQSAVVLPASDASIASAAPVPTRISLSARLPSSVVAVPTILLRKYYHGIALAMFVPAVIVEPAFACLALTGAFTVFLMAEYIRISTLPPLATSIRSFMRRYLDDRDRGALVLTHIYLLVGCALPVWLHAPIYLKSTATPPVVPSPFPVADSLFSAIWLPAISGVLVLGVGDTAASAVGYAFGERRWQWPAGSRKTLLGTGAAIVAVLLNSVGLTIASYYYAAAPFTPAISDLLARWTRADTGFVLATIAAGLFEAFTTQIDNLFLPLYYYAALTLAR